MSRQATSAIDMSREATIEEMRIKSHQLKWRIATLCRKIGLAEKYWRCNRNDNGINAHVRGWLARDECRV